MDLDLSQAEAGRRVTLDYTNWRGERRKRNVQPICLSFGSNRWHTEPQWILQAWDVELGEVRGFALLGIHGAELLPESAQCVYASAYGD